MRRSNGSVSGLVCRLHRLSGSRCALRVLGRGRGVGRNERSGLPSGTHANLTSNSAASRGDVDLENLIIELLR
jgi:hypothetical protein